MFGTVELQRYDYLKTPLQTLFIALVDCVKSGMQISIKPHMQIEFYLWRSSFYAT